MTIDELVVDIATIYGALLEKTPIDSLSDDSKSRVIESLLNASGVFLKMTKEIDFLSSQIDEINASIDLKKAQIDEIKLSLKLKKSLTFAQVCELKASKTFKKRQTSALDDAVRRDTAKIVCEALAIIKSGGNNAGTWWDVASKSINALSGNEELAKVQTDPT